ncbi:MAG: transglutaminase-like cysteine peptidase [Pseudomonadota bacterium]
MDDATVLRRGPQKTRTTATWRVIVFMSALAMAVPADARLPSAYQSLLTRVAELDETERVRAIHRWVNDRIRFASDAELWGQRDYWATPYETALRSQGDCEDIALLKAYLLTRARIAATRLELVLMTATTRHWSHMVLVYRGRDGATLVLDNLPQTLRGTRAVAMLRPAYSFGPGGARHYRGAAPKRFPLRRVDAWRDFESRLAAAGAALWNA